MLHFFQLAILQLAYCMLAEAAPVSIQSNAGGGIGGGIVGLIVLILDIIAWVEIFKSSRPTLNKVIWALVVFFFPLVGMLVYYLFSERHKYNDSGYEAIPS